MLNPLHRSTQVGTARRRSLGSYNGLSLWRDAVRNVNWKLIVFCVALWWFIYSAPTEGILTSHFWSASTVANSDDF